MKQLKFAKAFLTAIFAVLLAACAGAGDESTSSTPDSSEVVGIDDSGITPDEGENYLQNVGIDGSGVVSSGPIDAFGSIITGNQYWTTDGAQIIVNGAASTEKDLKVGYYVTLIGESQACPSPMEFNCFRATTVIYQPFLRGPVQAVSDVVGTPYKAVTILNTTVIVHPDDTVFGDVFNFADLTEENWVDRWVEVSGVLLRGEVLLATRFEEIEAQNRVQMNTTLSSIEGGVVRTTNGYSFKEEEAVRFGFGDTPLAAGQRILIEAPVPADGVLSSPIVTLLTAGTLFEGGSSSISRASFEVQGQIDGLNAAGDRFTVSGFDVEAPEVSLNPGFLELSDGLSVEITGSLEAGTITADPVIYVRKLYEEGVVREIFTDDGYVRVYLPAYGEYLLIKVNDNSRINSDITAVDLSLNDLNLNDWVSLNLDYGSDEVFKADTITVISDRAGSTTVNPAGFSTKYSVQTSLTESQAIFTAQYTQADIGSLNLVLVDRNNYGRIVSYGTATLDGELSVTSTTILFELGDKFSLLTASEITGRYDSVSLPELDDGLAWDVSELYTTGVIAVVAVAPMQLLVNTGFNSELGTGTSVSLRFFGSLLGSAWIDWGDGTETKITAVPAVYQHTYSEPSGEYTIKVYGGVTGFGWEDEAPLPEDDIAKLVGVKSWGTTPLESLHGAFRDHPNFNNIPEQFPFTTVDVTCMFCGGSVSLGNSVFSRLKFQNVKYMDRLFEGYGSLDTEHNPTEFPDITGWDVSGVESMSSMFKNSTFNQAIGGWDVSQVTDMSEMFMQTSFNQDISDWDVSSVMYMQGMFDANEAFTGVHPVDPSRHIGKWDTSNVRDMSKMFWGAKNFNAPIGSEIAGELRPDTWDTGNVMDMNNMFWKAVSFNQHLNNWNVSSVTNMKGMFQGAVRFNGIINDWNTGRVETMDGMFKGAVRFNRDIGHWDVENLKYMGSMFQNAGAFNQSLEGWTLRNIISFPGWFDSSIRMSYSTANWDLTLIAWANNPDTNSEVGFWGLPACYTPNSEASEAAAYLEEVLGWSPLDDC